MSLVAEWLALSRGNVTVVDIVRAFLDEGQVTAICGPNGVGKSTLLMGLAGLIAPTRGKVVLDNRPLAKLNSRERARRIGYLPQSADIAWDVSVQNLVALGRLPHRDHGRAEIDAAIAALGLDDLRKRPASELSGGEKARALLARVVAGEPDWILADEPFAALDLAHQLSLINHFKRAASEGRGVVLVVHDLNLAMNHADRVLVLGCDEPANSVVADGPPEEALSPDNIQRCWGVDARWIGQEGERALIVG